MFKINRNLIKNMFYFSNNNSIKSIIKSIDVFKHKYKTEFNYLNKS